MPHQQLFEKITAIKNSNPGNLMARHFDPEYFSSLSEVDQRKLLKIFASGLENPDSSMGAYAMHLKDYDQFATQLDPMIRDFHNISEGIEIAQEHDWDTSRVNCDLSAIDGQLQDVSMRVRVARNVATFPLPGAMSKAQRIEFEALASEAFAQLAENPEYGGKYLSITPGSPDEIDHDEYDRRVKAHQMFKDMSATDTSM